MAYVTSIEQLAEERGLQRGLKRGLERGLQLGREEGRQALITAARKMLAEGIEIDTIVRVTGLQPEDFGVKP